jgi:hypothetical protein
MKSSWLVHVRAFGLSGLQAFGLRVKKSQRFEIHLCTRTWHAVSIFCQAIQMKRARSPDVPVGHHRMPDGSLMKDSDHVSSSKRRRAEVSQAEEFAMLADTLASRPDLLRSDPLPREDPYVTDGISRVALGRLGRAEASARPRTVATDVPQTPRRRGENRPASTFNRGPGYVPPSMAAAMTDVIDLT